MGRLLGAALGLLAFCSALGAADPAEVILHDGQIVTVDDEFRIAEALAVRDEKILAVGTDKEVLRHAGEQTKRIDLAGRTVLPGLIDSHTHPLSAAMYEFDHRVPDMQSIDDVLDYIRSRAKAVEDGTWIVVRQVFITRLREQRYPTRKELDRVAPNNPVYFSTGPDASVNSLALELSGIDKDFRIPEGETGRIERDPQTGEPTGILRSAGRFIQVGETGRKSPSKEDRYRRLKTLLADYNSVGITSISDRNAGGGAIRLYQQLRDNGELTCRVYCYRSFNPHASPEQIRRRIREIAEHPLHEYDSRLWVRGLKVFLDGGMLTGSAYMREPWGKSDIYSITDPEYRGMRYIEQQRLRRIARLALKNDLQMTAHAVGDGAVHALIQAYESINREFSIRERRPCVTHCNFMSRQAIETMQELGIVADLQPAWLYLDGATLRKQFGTERLRYFQPYRSLFEGDVIIGGGSDHMQKIGSLRSINPYNPFLGMWITLRRQPRWTDEPLHPEQRISREQAIRLYTINNAYLTFEEDKKGSLEQGKFADFIVLDTDILNCPVDRIKEIGVEQTYMDGRLVYRAEKKTPAKRRDDVGQ